MFHVVVYRGFAYNIVKIIEAPSCRKATVSAEAQDNEIEHHYKCEGDYPFYPGASRKAKTLRTSKPQ